VTRRGPGAPKAAIRALAVLALLATADAALAAVPLPPWQRVELSRVPPGECQELRIARVGEGLLQVRFFATSHLEATGPDLETEGASLLVPAADPERATLVVYDPSGPYARSARVAPPVRWSVGDGRLCVASGSEPRLCGAVAAAPTRFVEIAFGPGWETDVVGCSAIGRPAPRRGSWALAALLAAAVAGAAFVVRGALARGTALVLVGAASLALAAHVRPFGLLGPDAAAGAGLLGACIGLGALFARRASVATRGASVAPRGALATLGALVALVAATAPHPVAAPEPAAQVVAPLFTDAAFWHARGPHQSLEFRDRPLASLDPRRESWLVLGGSVAFGEGVETDETFTAVAEARLHEDGRAIDLYDAGAHGWNLAAIDRWLRDLGDAFPVRGLVLVSILNNATLPIPGPRPAGCDASLVRAWACNQWRSLFFFTWPKVFWPKPHNPERHAALLRGLLERETALGRGIVLMDEPSEAQIHGGLFRRFGADDYRAATRAIGGDFGLALHPVADALATLPEGEAFIDGIHPTAAAHRLWGERLAEILAARP